MATKRRRLCKKGGRRRPVAGKRRHLRRKNPSKKSGAGRGRRARKSGGRYHRKRDRKAGSRRCRSRHRRRSAGRRGSRRASRRARQMSSDFNIPLHVPKNLQDFKFDTYIKRVQKKLKPNLGMKKQTVEMMDNLMKDTLHQIATKAASKMGRRKTLKPRLLLRAMRKVMPKALADRVNEHAQLHLDMYDRKKRCPKRRR